MRIIYKIFIIAKSYKCTPIISPLVKIVILVVFKENG